MPACPGQENGGICVWDLRFKILEMRPLLPVIILAVLGLLGSTFWYKRAFERQQKQLALVSDTLSRLLLQQHDAADRWHSNDLLATDMDKILGPKNLELGDSLLEIHRIRWATNELFAFLLRQYKSGEVTLDYRRFTLQNPLTKTGKTAVLASAHVTITAADFLRFRAKIAAIPFFDATHDNNPMCCLATGSLQWEARLSDHSQLKHHTTCRQSVQFSEACESIMRLAPDPVLMHALAGAGQ
jgi:hypothetical protein